MWARVPTTTIIDLITTATTIIAPIITGPTIRRAGHIAAAAPNGATGAAGIGVMGAATIAAACAITAAARVERTGFWLLRAATVLAEASHETVIAGQSERNRPTG